MFDLETIKKINKRQEKKERELLKKRCEQYLSIYALSHKPLKKI